MKIYLFCNDEIRAVNEFLKAFTPDIFSYNTLSENEIRNQEELSAKIVDTTIAELNNADLIVIHLEEELENLCFYIGHRIRLHAELRIKPLIFFGKKNILNLISESPFLPMILVSKGSRYFENNFINTKLIDDFPAIKNEAIELSDIEIFRGSILRKLRLPEPDKQGRHSIANQWGARQLAMAGGIDVADRQISDALYFQLLTAGIQDKEIREDFGKFKSNKDSKLNGEFEFPEVNRVLLIDDNFEKGWQQVLTGLFSKWNRKNKPRIDPYSSFSSECEESLKKIDYDFVLLDFYFGENDMKGKGLDFLDKIKKTNPVLPVIMFTASNKAWNMNELYEAGADGYYIKEHPETASDENFSVNNFNSFVKTIDRCRKKGKLLKPYWQALQNIEALFSAEQGPVKENTLSDGSQSNFKGRISERITMFIGLLKKAYEQTEFDEKAFFYSDYELAFLTLWSVLNELQESLFDKDQPATSILDKNGQVQTHHIHCANGRRPKIRYDRSHFRWSFRNRNFIEYKYDLRNTRTEINRDGYYNLKDRGTEVSKFVFYKETRTFTNLDSPEKPEKTYWDKLFIQIAFLLSELESPAMNLSNLLSLNEVRNKLFLTHGGNANSPDFSLLYNSGRANSEIWKQRIKDLFSIVNFLCTAKEWNPSS